MISRELNGYENDVNGSTGKFLRSFFQKATRRRHGHGRVAMALRFYISVFLVMILMLAAGCVPVASEDRVLFDFEEDGDLDRLHWKCGTLYSLSTEHAFRGERSLKMTLYPSDYPGFFPRLDVSDWRGYTALAMEIYNPSSDPVLLTLRVDDDKKTEYGQRYNGRVVAGPGKTSLVLPFDALVTSGTHRPLNLKGIQRCLLFTSTPKSRQVLYLDAVRLVAGRPKEGA